MKIEKKRKINKVTFILTVRLLCTLLLITVAVISTVMIRFSARGAYLLLVPQRRALIRDKALLSFLRNNLMLKTKL